MRLETKGAGCSRIQYSGERTAQSAVTQEGVWHISDGSWQPRQREEQCAGSQRQQLERQCEPECRRGVPLALPSSFFIGMFHWGGGLLPERRDLSQPPSIRPISSTWICACVYFFRSIARVSLASRRKTRSTLRSTLTVSRIATFCPEGCWLARSNPSMIASMRSSARCQSACRSCFGMPPLQLPRSL